MYELNWQEKRQANPTEFYWLMATLGMSQAACGRYLGCSARTVNRYLKGEAAIPPAEVLLLRSLVVTNTMPLVPRREQR